MSPSVSRVADAGDSTELWRVSLVEALLDALV